MCRSRERKGAMAGRRDGSLMRDKGQSLRGSRIALAILTGVLLGCVFAFLFPHGFFSSDPPIQHRRLDKSGLQVRTSDLGASITQSVFIRYMLLVLVSFTFVGFLFSREISMKWRS